MAKHDGVVSVGEVSGKMRRRSVTALAAGAVAVALIVPATASATSAPSANRALAGHPAAFHVGGKLRTAGQINGARMSRATFTTGRSNGVTHAHDSSNWSGLAGTGRGIAGAIGAWTVPTAKASSRALYSSSWVGVDGDGNQHLIQTGTDEFTKGLKYSAWIEILPAAAQTIYIKKGVPAPVKPGDKMVAYVREVKKGVWTIFIENITRKWDFKQNFKYTGPGASIETIEEAPTIGGRQSVPSDFGTVHFSELGVAIKGKSGWYNVGYSARNEIYMKQHGRVLAKAGAPVSTKTGQKFNDTYTG